MTLKYTKKRRQEREKENSEAVKISEGAIEREKVTEVSSSVTMAAYKYDHTDTSENRQSVEEYKYAYDIYCYLRQLEGGQCIKSNYLAGQTELIPKMRAILIDWLVHVHSQFHLVQETLYFTVSFWIDF